MVFLAAYSVPAVNHDPPRIVERSGMHLRSGRFGCLKYMLFTWLFAIAHRHRSSLVVIRSKCPTRTQEDTSCVRAFGMRARLQLQLEAG